MVFFRQIRTYIICFILFGVWSTWQNFRYRLILKIYSVSLIIAVFCVYVISIFLIQFTHQSKLATIVGNTSFFVIMALQFVISFESIVKSKVQVQLVQKFSVVDQLFRLKFRQDFPYSEESTKLCVLSAILVSIIFTIKISIWIYTRFYNSILNYYFCSMYSSWITRLRLLQVLFFVYLLQNRLKLVNEKLLDIRMYGRISTYDELLQLKYIYGNLHDINELINMTFGTSLLIIVTQNFVDFTSNCYWIFLIIESSSLKIDVLIICIILLIPNAIILGTLCFYCSTCFQQVLLLNAFYDISNIWCNIILLQCCLVEANLHRLRIDRENYTLRNLVREFAMQIHHGHFYTSANGFFDIDLNLLGSVCFYRIFYIWWIYWIFQIS